MGLNVGTEIQWFSMKCTFCYGAITIITTWPNFQCLKHDRTKTVRNYRSWSNGKAGSKHQS